MEGKRKRPVAASGHGQPGSGERRGRMVLVLGGARSGKSSFAQRLARQAGGDRVLFVATGQANDAEMAERIDRHRRLRPAGWRTVEVQAGRLVGRLEAEWHDEPVLLLDCVSLLVSQFLPAHEEPTGEPLPGAEPVWQEVRRELVAFEQLLRRRDATAILVSNETGWGVVPPYPSGRLFRDVLGWANQFLAALADEVWLLVAGLPLRLKPGLAGAPAGSSPPPSCEAADLPHPECLMSDAEPSDS